MQTLINYGHQGDLNFRKVENIPNGAIEITKKLMDQKRGGYLLALGEHTNHAHVMVKEKDSSIQIMEQNGRRYLVVNGNPVKLLHGTFIAPGKIREEEKDKHATIVLPPGIYEQDFEIAYDPFLRQLRRVAD